MSCVICRQQQNENVSKKRNKRAVSFDGNDLTVRFSQKQIISVWRKLPYKERFIVFLVDMRQLGVERVAEIMNKPVVTVRKEVGQARALVKNKLFPLIG